MIFIPFYLYLPAKTSRIEIMNATVDTDHVDILCVGSSHMMHGLNPIQMYRDYGFATYEIWGGSLSPWQSYYFLTEACRYQKPKIVIIDVYKLGTTHESAYEDKDTVGNMVDTPISLNKINTIMESEADSKIDIILRFPYIHDEYNLFSGPTLKKFYGTTAYSMGYIYDNVVDIEEQEKYGLFDARNVSGELPVSPKNEKYLRKMIEYCLERGTGVILVNAPWPMIDEVTQKRYNYIGKIASEYGIDFIDGNLLWNELDMDWTADCSGQGGHLNHSGTTRFTYYVENFIHENYNVPDRRNDPEYNMYEKGIEWLECEISTYQ